MNRIPVKDINYNGLAQNQVAINIKKEKKYDPMSVQQLLTPEINYQTGL